MDLSRKGARNGLKAGTPTASSYFGNCSILCGRELRYLCEKRYAVHFWPRIWPVLNIFCFVVWFTFGMWEERLLPLNVDRTNYTMNPFQRFVLKFYLIKTITTTLKVIMNIRRLQWLCRNVCNVKLWAFQVCRIRWSFLSR